MFKLRQLIILLVLCLLPLAITLAQSDVPPQVQEAVRLLNQRLGTNLTIRDMQRWSYDIQVFDSSNLGCASQPGTPGSYQGYIVELVYAGVTYDIRVSGDGSIGFICGSNATPTPAFCEGSLTPRLTVGQSGRVVAGGLPNSLRVQPDPTAGAVGEIPPGASFLVRDGPRCNAGYTWWQVDYNGVVGWTPEGDPNEYWLEPATAATATPTRGQLVFATQTPTLTPQPTVLTAIPGDIPEILPAAPIALTMMPTVNAVTCSGRPARLTIGQQARVQLGGFPNNVRDNPGVSSAYLGEIPPGAVFNVLGGPNCASGYTWWQVDYNGLVGWTPEGDPINYWLEPLTNPREAFAPTNLNRTILRGALGSGAYDGGGIAFNADSSLLIMRQSGNATLWDMTTNSPLLSTPVSTPAYFAFNPTDSRVIAVLNAQGSAYTLTIEDDLSITETDLFTVPDFTAESDVFGIVWSGERLLFALRTGTNLDIWDGTSGQQVASLQSASVRSAVFKDDASGLYYTGEDGVVYEWDAATNTRELIATYPVAVWRLAVWQSLLVIVTDGLTTGMQSVEVRDMTNGTTVYLAEVLMPSLISNLALSDGVLAVSIDDVDGSALGLWDLETSTQIWLPESVQPARTLRFSPDGTMLAVGSVDNAVRVWGIAAP